MPDSIFSRVDNYLIDRFNLEDSLLKDIRTSVADHDMPQHSISAVQGKFLYMLARIVNAKRMIEIGTLAGYSTVWLGRALGTNGRLISIEKSPAYAAVARENIRKAGLSEKVEVRTGNALTILNQLEQDFLPFDLLFMDADKTEYVEYFNKALESGRPGALIVADNVIRKGEILDEATHDEKAIVVKKYLDTIAGNERVDTSILQQVGLKGHDGLALSMLL